VPVVRISSLLAPSILTSRHTLKQLINFVEKRFLVAQAAGAAWFSPFQRSELFK
jgi:hypothetical protein